jgi:hypothetical protein
VRVKKQGSFLPRGFYLEGSLPTLTPKGIKPGNNKLKAIKDAKPPTDIKTIRSFMGLCNFFWTHIKDFALIAAPLFKLTWKDSGYKSGQVSQKWHFGLSTLYKITYFGTSHGIS